jgi:hypothetical protein
VPVGLAFVVDAPSAPNARAEPGRVPVPLASRGRGDRRVEPDDLVDPDGDQQRHQHQHLDPASLSGCAQPEGRPPAGDAERDQEPAEYVRARLIGRVLLADGS